MIYICIPACNEEQTVGVVLWKIRQVMADYPRDYQLLVVDDASTDKTPEVLAPYARVLPLTVVRPERRQGEGAALEMMLREAVRRSEYPKRDVAITLQADFTHEPDDLVTLIKGTEAGADIVAGERQVEVDEPLQVRWARRLALRLLRRGRVPAGVRDPFTGYRAYRVSVIKGALADRPGRLVHWGNWAGAAELLLAAAPHARRIDTVQVMERPERRQRPSRLRPWRALLNVWSLTREAKPLQVTSPADLEHAMRSVTAAPASKVAERKSGGNDRPVKSQRSRSGGERPGREAGRSKRAAGKSGSGSNSSAPREREGEKTGAAAARKTKSKRAGAGDGESKPAAARSDGRRGRRRPEARKAAAAEPPVVEEQESVPAKAAAAEIVTESGVGDAKAAVDGASKPRRKRPRRRKRSPAAKTESGIGDETREPEVRPAADAPVAAPNAVPDAVAASSGIGGKEPASVAEGSKEEGAEAPAGTRPRRRRRGRRGGRRRTSSHSAPAEGGGEQSGEAEARADSRAEAAGQLSILELIEGERSDGS